jgi:probable phosphoglycerate mutase
MKNQGPTILLCRHGETEWTLSGRHTGCTDIPLTENGKVQARKLGERLRAIDFEAVFTSPLLRAKETCEIAGFGKKMILEPDAVEWNYGAYEGLTSEEIWRKTPSWNLFSDGAPGGESPQEAGLRADRIIQKLTSLQGTSALFSHGHFLRVLAARWLGLSPSAARLLALSVASLSILGFERSQRVLRLWNSQD